VAPVRFCCARFNKRGLRAKERFDANLTQLRFAPQRVEAGQDDNGRANECPLVQHFAKIPNANGHTEYQSRIAEGHNSGDLADAHGGDNAIIAPNGDQNTDAISRASEDAGQTKRGSKIKRINPAGMVAPNPNVASAKLGVDLTMRRVATSRQTGQSRP